MKWAHVLIFIAVVGLATATRQQYLATAELATAISELEEQVDPLVTTWTDANNATHTVTTHRKEGQTKEAWAADHAETVAIMQEHFPPVE